MNCSEQHFLPHTLDTYCNECNQVIGYDEFSYSVLCWARCFTLDRILSYVNNWCLSSYPHCLLMFVECKWSRL